MSNGSTLLPGVDGRSTWARRLRDLIGMHLADLGGEAAVSAAEASIVRRAATLTVELETMEARFAAAGQASADDLDLYQRTAGNLRRLLESVGLERRAREVPTLASYLAAQAAEKPPDASKKAAALDVADGAGNPVSDLPDGNTGPSHSTAVPASVPVAGVGGDHHPDRLAGGVPDPDLPADLAHDTVSPAVSFAGGGDRRPEADVSPPPSPSPPSSPPPSSPPPPSSSPAPSSGSEFGA